MQRTLIDRTSRWEGQGWTRSTSYLQPTVRSCSVTCAPCAEDAAVAEELTAETFYRAYTHFDSFRGDSKLETWLCAIAKNAYLKDCRRSARTVGADALETLPAETDFVERFLDLEQAQQIYRHVHELGAQYKEVFLLRTLGELSFRDIADIFGKSESWAKVTYFRAKNKIIERMEGST